MLWMLWMLWITRGNDRGTNKISFAGHKSSRRPTAACCSLAVLLKPKQRRSTTAKKGADRLPRPTPGRSLRSNIPKNSES
jgi:hypothetical protein